MNVYLPVTVEAARKVALHFQKCVVVIFSIDHVHDKSHFTSYGTTPQMKEYAAQLSDQIAEAIDHMDAVHENGRDPVSDSIMERLQEARS